MNENENVNTPNDENEDDLTIGTEQTGEKEQPDTPAGEDGAVDVPGEDDVLPDDGETPEEDDIPDDGRIPGPGGIKLPEDGETPEDGGETTGEDDANPEEGEEGEDSSEDDEEDRTDERTEVSCDEDHEPTFNGLTGFLLGTTLVLAVAVAILAAMLRRRQMAPVVQESSPAESDGAISVGKLHELGDRESQQDSFAVSPQEMVSTHGLLAVVADGMGGLTDGDKVSQGVVASMLDGFFSAAGTPGDILLSLTERANRKTNQLLGPGNIGKSGSTLVAGLIRDGMFHYVSVGDSRICLYRDGQLIQLNREHIYRNELAVQALNGVGTLQEAARHPKAAGLTSYLGMGNLRSVDIPACGIRVRSGDKYILMSDGVYNALSEAELSGALNEDAPHAAEKIRTMIADKAYRHQDNYTAVVLGC